MDDLESKFYQLEFAVSRSMRYMAKRRSFFLTLNQCVRIITAIGGAGTVASIFGDQPAIAVFGGIVGFGAAVDLVFEFAKRAMTYDHLFRCYADLGIDIAKSPRSDDAYRLLLERRLLIERDEPDSLDVLNVVCANDELEARGFDHRYLVRRWQRRFCQLGDIGEQSFPQIPAPQSALPVPTP